MKKISTLLSAAAIFAAAQVNNQAIVATFFGEDVGNGETGQPPGSLISAPYPNSAAAEANFLSLLTGAGTEDFESHLPTQGTPLLVTFPGAGNALLLGGGEIASGANNVGRYPISGNQYWDASTDNFSIQFAQPVAAFGFYGVDIGDFNGQVTLAFDGVVSDFVLNVGNSINVAGGGILYFGYINTDNPFTSITFGNTAPPGTGGDGFAFDDMTIGNVQQIVRTPDIGSTLMLLGAAVGGLGLLRRPKG